MARRTPATEEGLTDIPDEEDQTPPAKEKPGKKTTTKQILGNPDLSCQSREEAELVLQESMKGFEKVYNWSGRENQNLPPGEQLIFMAIETNYKKRQVVRDGKPVVDAAGNPVYEEPYANIQIKLPLSIDAISLPLHQAVQLPGGN